jgi:hypothetical protein
MKALISLIIVMQFSAFAAQAATAGQIVTGDVTAHSPDALNEELKVFESVGEGIQVIMAVCQDQPDCTFAISGNEIERLIETLDDRISQIDSALHEGDIGQNYMELLDEYRDTREQYALYRREIQDITRAIEEGTFYVEDALPDASTDPYDEELPALWEPRYRHDGLSLDMFEDADEPLPFD